MDAPAGPLVWRVLCEVCDWKQDRCESRAAARSLGNAHVATRHHADDEWEFRVQGVRLGPAALRAAGATVDGKHYDAHLWVPKPTSRNKSLPCGICSIYRYVHDDIFGMAVAR